MTSKTALNSIRGLQNREAGKAFEDEIATTLEVYKLLKLAAIDKTPEPMRVLQSLGKGRFMACFEGKAQADFKGTLRGGAAVVFEAKHTSTDQMSQDVVTEAQSRMLTLHTMLGARCYVLVSFGYKKYYRLPWGLWREMKSIFGHKYVTEPEIEQYRVPVRSGVTDFLGLIK